VPKYRRSAVERNQLKRRLREIVRLEILALLASVDVVVKSQPHAYGVEYSKLRDDLQQTVSEAGALLK